MEYRPFALRTRVALRRFLTRRKILVGGGVILGFLIVSPVLTYLQFAHDISNRERLMNKNSTGIVIRDRNGEVLYSYGKIDGDPDLSLEQISDNLEQALLASEDQGFYSHEGFSIRGIARALYANLLNKDPVLYGGSTITQQLVKNKLLGKSENYFSKYQEVTMSVAVEREYSKREIMEMYLNSVYFGEGAFGVAAAAQTYFKKPAAKLTLEESSMLVGILPAPSAFSPISGDKQEAKERQERVLRRMVETGYIDQGEKTKAEAAKLKYAPPPDNDQGNAQHFVQMVIDKLEEQYGEESIARQGFDITTSLDMNWQKQAEERIKNKVRETKEFGANNASLVAMDPRNGEVKALVGSVDWDNPEFGEVNMATSPRQPGSSFKPIYYSEALDNKLVTAATILDDKPVVFGDYRPENFDFRFRGKIPLRHALAQSLNIPSIEVMRKLGVENASEAAQRMGISTVNKPDSYGLTLALGTAEVSVLDMTNAYGAFANGGVQSEPKFIISIKDKYGDDVFNSEKDERQVISPEASFLITSILSDDQARSPTFGSSLNIDGKKVAVKTGTTDESRDAWTLGFTPDLSVGVWFGNNRHRPMEGLVGSTSAGTVWRDTMSSLSASQNPDDTFKPPPGIIKAEVCTQQRLTFMSNSDKYDEFFIKGTEPDKCEKLETDDQPKRRNDEKDDDDEEDEQERDKPDDNGRGGGTSEPPKPEEDPPEDPPEDDPPEEEPPPSEGPSGSSD